MLILSEMLWIEIRLAEKQLLGSGNNFVGDVECCYEIIGFVVYA